MKYVTARDIVIPAGTEVNVEQPLQVNYFCGRALIVTAETKDNTSEWSMPLDEAIDLGIVVLA